MNAPHTPHNTTYDTLPYRSHAFVQTHPERLAVMATLFGMNPPPPANCRVLELGCASGGNLLPMATMMPDARFVGIDLSGRQIEEGRAVVAASGASNIELRQFDITQITREFGEFDYIIAHGVYSWIPANARDHLLRVCKENLSPNGVAYVSYNVYPGWHMRGMLRDMMLYHARQFPDIAVQVQQARALLDFLGETVPTENSPFGMMLKLELQTLRQQGDSYIAHEFLEGDNAPVYFHDFAELAASKGLQYLGETEFHTMLTTNFAPSVSETLRKISTDLIRSEQYMDFLRNRAFRQTLLVHAGVALNRNLRWEDIPKFYVSTKATIAQSPPINSAEMAKFVAPTGVSFSTPAPIVKAAMTLLVERSPLGYTFDELLAAARALVDASPPPSAMPGEPLPTDAPLLASELLKNYAAAMVELRMTPLRLVTHVSDHPKAADLARYQASHRLPITNQRHEHMEVDEFNRQLIAVLDGRHDHQALADALVEQVKAGTIVIARGDKKERVTDDQEIRKTIAEAVALNLPQLAKHSFLEA